jgi:hypothetical protein
MRAPPALGNPRRLLRVLDAVFGGTRRIAQIARQLDLEVRVVRLYLTHAAYLGLIVESPDPQLTGPGLEYTLFPRLRSDVLARLAANDPLLAAPPNVDALADRLAAGRISESPAFARRDARAILRLAEGARRARAVPEEAQLHLAFPGPIATAAHPAQGESGDDNLDLYTLVLRGLLDHGELSLATLRGLLDVEGAQNAGLGAYAALAVRRKDATRRGESLVITAGAIARAGLAESAVSIALSDIDFRQWLTTGVAAASETARCLRWGRRLFGSHPVSEALPRLLFGRRLDSFPLAGSAGPDLPLPTGSFIEAIGRGGVALAIPRCVAELAGGLPWVHAGWRGSVQAPAGARTPSSLDARTLVYGGLFAPGEAPPRNIPDLLSLRLRAVRNVPALALLVVAGQLHRKRQLRLRERGDELWLELAGREPIAFAELLATTARLHGWTLCLSPGRSPWPGAVQAAERLGLMVRVRDLITIDDVFAARLATDPEHHELHEQLSFLREAVESAVGRLRATHGA